MSESATSWQIHHGDCRTVMGWLDPESVDAIVTDPPYGLDFMGKEWDRGVPGVEFWTAALRVARPGAHLLAFGGTRTYHRLTCAIEDAGWEIRDCLSWLYGSGFPKSHNGAWGGTALKPAWEPIILARKPLIGTVATNHAQHGTGGLNIDGCRIAHNEECRQAGRRKAVLELKPEGRWPANVALDEEAARLLDEQTGALVSGSRAAGQYGKSGDRVFGQFEKVAQGAIRGSTGGASRFFYVAKASRSEREAGLEAAGISEQVAQSGMAGAMPTDDQGRERDRFRVTARNTHPTVKPVGLMRWLVRLITPPGGVVLDPFAGSGTTGVATYLESRRFIGAEINAEYVEIAKARIAHAAKGDGMFA